MVGLRRAPSWWWLRSRRRRELFLEPLEDRRLLALFIVNSVGDEPDWLPGDGQARTASQTTTLRAAIMEANAQSGKDRIEFHIPDPGPHVIELATRLPTIMDPIAIDGYTQPGARPTSLTLGQGNNAIIQIELDGSLLPIGANGLEFFGGQSEVRGLAIHSFRGRPMTHQAFLGTTIVAENGLGIWLWAGGNSQIVGNFLGLTAAGQIPLAPLAAVAIAVQGVNAPPRSTDDLAQTDQDVSVVVDVLANDTDADDDLDPTRLVVVEAPRHGSAAVDPATGAITYTPAASFHGGDALVYRVLDAAEQAATATVRWEVRPTSAPPNAGHDAAETAADTPVSLDVLANDMDPDSQVDLATLRLETPPRAGTLAIQADGRVRYTPRGGFAGTDTFGYSVADDAGARSNTAVVTVTVRSEPALQVVGRAFEDLDAAGPCLDGPGIAGYVVHLLDGQRRLLASTSTQADDPHTREDETGWYRFSNLPPGTYTIVETQPLLFQDGRDTPGTPAVGACGDDRFEGLELAPGMALTDYNFGEYGLRAQFISKQLPLASTPPATIYLGQFKVAAGESLLLLEAPADGTLRVATTSVLVTLDAEPVPSPVHVHTNQARIHDVNGDGVVSPRDARLVINSLNATGTRRLPPVNLGAYCLDVDADDYLSPHDALLIINALNQTADRSEGERPETVWDRAPAEFLAETEDTHER